MTSPLLWSMSGGGGNDLSLVVEYVRGGGVLMTCPLLWSMSGGGT